MSRRNELIERSNKCAIKLFCLFGKYHRSGNDEFCKRLLIRAILIMFRQCDYFRFFLLFICLSLNGQFAFAQNCVDCPRFERISLNDKSLATITGYALPLSHVEIIDGARKLGETESNDLGYFVITLEKYLGVGHYQLVLRAADAMGRSVTSIETAMVLVPKSNTKEIFAMTQSLDGIKKFISDKPSVMNAGASNAFGFGIRRIIYHNNALEVTGFGPYGQQVLVSLDDKRLGIAQMTNDGLFLLARTTPLQIGDHIFRIDLINEAGETVHSIGVPFELSDKDNKVNQVYENGKLLRTVFVRPNETLSIIAKRIYGDTNYAVKIFDANRNKLTNMNQLFVNQELILPDDEAKNQKIN